MTIAGPPAPAANPQSNNDMDRPYTSKLIKATALLADTRLLLSEWDTGQDAADNLTRLRAQNVFGKASARRVEDVMRIFRQRYFDDPAVGRALALLAQSGAADLWLPPLLYFFAAQNDRTLRDLALEVVLPRRRAGYRDLPVELFYDRLRDWSAAGLTSSEWGQTTIERVGQHAAATLRDFGLLSGSTRKQIADVPLPMPAFALIAFWLRAATGSGGLTLRSPEWGLFLLDLSAVEARFMEAHQLHLLSYQAAGSIVRLDFPADTFDGYAARLLDAR